MCGRYTLATPAKKIKDSFGLAAPPELPPRYNIAPTQDVPALLQQAADHVRMVRWGMNRPRQPGGLVINARAETLSETAMFRAALRARRCVVIADGFYEWQRGAGGKVPMHIRLRSREPFAFAGLWTEPPAAHGTPQPACVIVTTAPNELVAPIHDRMPAILAAGQHLAWLDPEEQDPHRLRSLLAPFPAAAMEAVAVGDAVNKVANDGPHLLEPRRDTQLQLRLLE